MYSSTYIYICIVTTELLCRPGRVSKSEVLLANRAIYLCENRDPINQGHVCFFVFTSSWPLPPMASSQHLTHPRQVSARPTECAFFQLGNVFRSYSSIVTRVRDSASRTGLKKLQCTCLLKKTNNQFYRQHRPSHKKTCFKNASLAIIYI